MTMTLYPWEIDMNLGRIEAERMLVLAKWNIQLEGESS